MSVSFGGIGSIAATFKTDGTVVAGAPVKMSANGTVGACSAGDRFMGIATYIAEDGHATVQISGYIKVGYSGGTAPAAGYVNLSADGSGKVMVDETAGGEYLVIDVDTADETAGIII